jgi:hypothetical protein
MDHIGIDVHKRESQICILAMTTASGSQLDHNRWQSSLYSSARS